MCNVSWKESPISELMGKTLTSVIVVRKDGNDGDNIIFNCSDGTGYKMFHDQDCCESVRIEDIIGDLNDLVGSPIFLAEEESNNDEPDEDGSHTWTFYKFSTVKANVTIRWFGESNGYYSEGVDFRKIEEK